MENTQPRKLALCESRSLVLHPNTPYIFVAIHGCSKCDALAKEADESFAQREGLFRFIYPETSDRPSYATAGDTSISGSKKSKKKTQS